MGARPAIAALKRAIGLAAFLAAGPVFSQDIETMTPPELLAALEENAAELIRTEALLEENGRDADQNRAEIKALRAEDKQLGVRAGIQDADLAKHNRQVDGYNKRCQGEKLPEDVYLQCLELRQNLEIQRERLDGDAEALAADYAAHNQRVAASNESEAQRAAEADRLFDHYRALDQAIRDIQVRLYDLSTRSEQSGFSEQVRQCTLHEDPNDISSCMARVWGG